MNANSVLLENRSTVRKKKNIKRKKEKEEEKRMKLRAFTLHISLNYLCKDFATGAFSAIHMRSNVPSDAKIDIVLAEIREGRGRERELRRAGKRDGQSE